MKLLTSHLLAAVFALACDNPRTTSQVPPSDREGRSPQAHRDAYVAQRYVQQASGVRHIDAALLEPLHGVSFALARVADSLGEMLWLNREVRRVGSHSEWEVIAVLPLPPVQSNHRLVFGMYGCRVADSPEGWEIIALAEFQNAPEFRTIHQAWRADRSSGQIQAIATNGIACFNEGYGV